MCIYIYIYINVGVATMPVQYLGPMLGWLTRDEWGGHWLPVPMVVAHQARLGLVLHCFGGRPDLLLRRGGSVLVR